MDYMHRPMSGKSEDFCIGNGAIVLQYTMVNMIIYATSTRLGITNEEHVGGVRMWNIYIILNLNH